MYKVLLLVLLLGLCQTLGKAHYRHYHGECQTVRMANNCQDRTYLASMRLHGNYWMFSNNIRTNHGNIRCCTDGTYCRHADFHYLDNMLPQAKAPLNAALHAADNDFERTAKRQDELIEQWISFQIYFRVKYIPGTVSNEASVDCNDLVPSFSEVPQIVYCAWLMLRYPVNVGCSEARDTSPIHCAVISNIGLYLSPGLPDEFMQMLRQTLYLMQPKRPIDIFENSKNLQISNTQTELQYQLLKGNAVSSLSLYHNAPRLYKWINLFVAADNRLSVFHATNRKLFEPIYIGTHNDAPYDDRLSWENMSHKLTKTYALSFKCYEFHSLNVFPMHKPFKKTKKESDYSLGWALKPYHKLIKPKKFGNMSNCSL